MSANRATRDALAASAAVAELSIWATTGVDLSGWRDVLSFGNLSDEATAEHKTEAARLAREQMIREATAEAYMASRDAAADRDKKERVLSQDPMMKEPIAVLLTTKVSE